MERQGGRAGCEALMVGLNLRCRGLLELMMVGVPLFAFAAGGGVERRPVPIKSDTRGSWRVGQPVAIEVQEGRASFRAPLLGPNSELLVVVSALSAGPGPYPIELRARGVAHEALPRLADDGLTRPSAKSPPLPPSLPPRPVQPPAAERVFHLLARDGDPSSPSNYVAVKGVLRGLGRSVQVYVAAEDQDAVDPGVIKDAVGSFDDLIEPSARERFTVPRDVDGDGRFTILFSSWLARLGKGAVDGYARPADFDPAFRPPLGNRCDMIYLNPALRPGPYLRTILAHEYRHAVLSSVRTECALGFAVHEEGWLDEAIAHLAEDDHGFTTRNIDYRVSAFLDRPERCRLRVQDYFAADLFRGHGERGSAYLFLRWCVDRYGAELTRSLVFSDKNGIANLEAATGATFASLFRRWSLAVFLSGRDASPAESEPLMSLNLRAPLDSVELMGPRTTRLSPGGEPECWRACGTSAHYVVIDGGSMGAVEVRVSGPPEARLQVTALPLGDGAGRLDLALERLPNRGGRARVRARVKELHGVPIRISALTWGPVERGLRPGNDDIRSGQLDMLGVAALFGGSLVPAHGERISKPIELDRDQPAVVRVIGTDAGGRRIAAWADMKLSRGDDWPSRSESDDQ